MACWRRHRRECQRVRSLRHLDTLSRSEGPGCEGRFGECVRRRDIYQIPLFPRNRSRWSCPEWYSKGRHRVSRREELPWQNLLRMKSEDCTWKHTLLNLPTILAANSSLLSSPRLSSTYFSKPHTSCSNLRNTMNVPFLVNLGRWIESGLSYTLSPRYPIITTPGSTGRWPLCSLESPLEIDA